VAGGLEREDRLELGVVGVGPLVGRLTESFARLGRRSTLELDLRPELTRGPNLVLRLRRASRGDREALGLVQARSALGFGKEPRRFERESGVTQTRRLLVAGPGGARREPRHDQRGEEPGEARPARPASRIHSAVNPGHGLASCDH
jgi:hypothetical protein